MNKVLQARVRAAGAELSKPGRWRLALEQLLQATTDLLADPEPDSQTIHLALDSLHTLYQWSYIMVGDDLRRLNGAVLKLSALVYSQQVLPV